MKRIYALLGLLLLSLALPVFNTHADGLIIINEAHWQPIPRHPHPLPHPPRPYTPLEVSYHHVDVKIDGQIATTSVDQEFYNPNQQQLEGTYLFPIPRGAQIDKFTMDIGGKMMEAELLPAAKARQIYEDIVRKLKDPALLEYADRDVFKVRIFPIEPRSKKRIKLSYTEVLKSDAGLVNYNYPLNTEKFSAAPVKNVSIKVELTSTRPLKSIYSPSHPVEIKRHGSLRATVGFEEDNVKPDTDFALYFAPEKDEIGVNLLTYKTGSDDGYFLLLASPGMDTKENRVVPKDVVFALDTSGSMTGKKLDQAKKALQFCVENLNDNDRFEIVRFSTEVEPLFDKLVEANARNRDQAEQFIKNLKPMGGTAIDSALQKSLATRPATGDRPFVVIFLTDGRPTIGETDEHRILTTVRNANESRTRVFCFGIGTDVNTHLLDQITEETRVFSQYVFPEEDLEVKLSNFFAKIKDPVLASPTIKFTGDVRVTKMYPSPLPDLFRGDQLILAGRFSGKGDSAVIIEGSVNGVTRKFTCEVNFPRTADDHEFIPRLWATRRVGYLLDEIRLRGESAELRDEVTVLARKYGIVTPYTAYLIVEDEAQRSVPMAMQTLPTLSTDTLARKDAAANWDSFKREKVGSGAVSGARFGNELKYAAAPAVAATKSTVEANRALGVDGYTPNNGHTGAMPPVASSAPADQSKIRLAQNSTQGQFIGGRNFYQNSRNEWVDENVQRAQNLKRQRLQFNSKEYFAFAAKERRALPWLALGQNVQFVLDETLYEIYDN